MIMDADIKRKLVTLGTGSGFSVADKGGPACLVQVQDTFMLLDCGEGAGGRLNDYQLLSSLQYVFISHLHADHISGLFVMLQNMKLAGRKGPLFIYMPNEGIAPFKEFLKSVYLDFSGINPPFPLVFKCVERMSGDDFQSFEIRAWQSDHFSRDAEKGREQRPAFGFTIDSGHHRLVYTADVETVDCFEAELDQYTTLVCEAAHINIEHLIGIARDKAIVKTIFVHLDPACEKQVKHACSIIPAVLAVDGYQTEW